MKGRLAKRIDMVDVIAFAAIAIVAGIATVAAPFMKQLCYIDMTTATSPVQRPPSAAVDAGKHGVSHITCSLLIGTLQQCFCGLKRPALCRAMERAERARTGTMVALPIASVPRTGTPQHLHALCVPLRRERRSLVKRLREQRGKI